MKNVNQIKSNSSNGITLIALIITIIVLLILAGVSISMVIGNNGILTKATKAKTETNTSTSQEELQMEINALAIDYYNSNSTASNLRAYLKEKYKDSNNNEYENFNKIKENLKNNYNKDATINTSGIEITYDSITFTIDENGTVKEKTE